MHADTASLVLSFLHLFPRDYAAFCLVSKSFYQALQHQNALQFVHFSISQLGKVQKKFVSIIQIASIQEIEHLSSNIFLLQELHFVSQLRSTNNDTADILEIVTGKWMPYLKHLTNIHVTSNYKFEMPKWNKMENTFVLQQVQVLHLSYCRLHGNVDEFNALKNLKELTLISCFPAEEQTFEPAFEHLDKLVIEGTALGSKSLEAIWKLKCLKHLELHDCEVSSIVGIGSLKNLIFLRLSSNSLSGTLPEEMANLSQLQTLKMENNRITDGLVLCHLTKLVHLEMQFNKVWDISFLSYLPQLQVLHINQNPISDVSSLAELKNLRTITVSSEIAANTNVLRNMNKLQQVYIPFANIDNVEFLENCKQLRKISIGRNKVANLSTLCKLPLLEHIDAMHNFIVTIGNFSNAANLQIVKLDFNNITDISGLAYCINLEELHIRHNKIQSLVPLSNMHKLRYVFAHNNQLHSAACIAHLASLESVELYNNYIQVEDVLLISSNPTVTRLVVNADLKSAMTIVPSCMLFHFASFDVD